MFPLFAFLMIISSVVALSGVNYDDYRTFCGSPVDTKKVVKIVKEHRSDEEDCEHAVGFHFNTQMCQTMVPLMYYNTNKSFSAFLSDDDQYLYIYVFLFSDDFKKKANSVDIKFKRWFLYPWSNPSPFLFVLWLKETQFHRNGYSYKINYSSKKDKWDTSDSITTETLSKRTDYQILLNEIKSFDTKLNISDALNPSSDISNRITIKDSYFIVCGRKSKDDYWPSKCRPFEQKERIICKCDRKTTEAFAAYVVLIIWSIALIMSTKPALETFMETEKTEKNVFSIQHNCTEKNFKFKYIILLRLAKASAGFDLKHVTIDVEFFTLNNESVCKQLF